MDNKEPAIANLLRVIYPSLISRQQARQTEQLLDAALPEWRAPYRAWLIANCVRLFAFLAVLVFVACVGGHTLSGITLAGTFTGMVLVCRVLKCFIVQPFYDLLAFNFLSTFIVALWFQMNLGNFLVSLLLYSLMVVAYIYKEGCLVTLKKMRSSIGI